MLVAKAKTVSSVLLYELGGESYLQRTLGAFNISCGVSSITTDSPYLRFQCAAPARNGADLVVIYHDPSQENYTLELWSIMQAQSGSTRPICVEDNLTLEELTTALEEYLDVPFSPCEPSGPSIR